MDEGEQLQQIESRQIEYYSEGKEPDDGGEEKASPMLNYLPDVDGQ